VPTNLDEINRKGVGRLIFYFFMLFSLILSDWPVWLGLGLDLEKFPLGKQVGQSEKKA